MSKQLLNFHPDLPPIHIKVHHQAKHLKLKVMSQSIHLTTPPRLSQIKIINFLQQHSDWLHQAWQSAQQKAITKIHQQIQIKLFDATHQQMQSITIHNLDGEKIAYQFKQNQLWLNTNHQEDAFKQFLLAYAKQHLPKFLMDIAQEMNLKPQKINIRHAKTRWGSCSYQGSIMLNAYLICCPIELIRYVCIHELAHLTHFNHSTHFWQLVAQFDHNYQQHRHDLKQIAMQF